MHWTTKVNAADSAKSPSCMSGDPPDAMLFRVVVNGRGTYYGFFPHVCDAISDALDHGAFSVAVVRA